MDDSENRQYAPHPSELLDLIVHVRFKPDWSFTLEDRERDHADVHSGAAGGLTLCIWISPADAYHPERKRPVVHLFPVPAATYDRRSWRRWLLERCLDVDRHEACEFFRLVDDQENEIERPFAPNHGPGRDPYTVFEYAEELDRRTAFTGNVNP